MRCELGPPTWRLCYEGLRGEGLDTAGPELHDIEAIGIDVVASGKAVLLIANEDQLATGW